MKRQPTRLIKTTVHHHTRNKFTINPYPFDLIVICVCYPEHPVHLICANIQRILQPGNLPRSVNVTKNRAAFTDNRPHGTALNINFAQGRRSGIDAIQTVKEQGQATWLRKNYLQTEQGFVTICQVDQQGTRPITYGQQNKANKIWNV